MLLKNQDLCAHFDEKERELAAQIIFFVNASLLCRSFTMVCLTVRGDNPSVSSSEFSIHVHVTNDRL